MSFIKYRTLQEAQNIKLPATSKEVAERAIAIMKQTSISNASSHVKLKNIYALSDEITKPISEFMVCKNGCSNCCHIDVLITTTEAQYIEKNLGIKLHATTRVSKGHSESKNPCTFLDEKKSCSIYNYRPFACRTYFALDNPAYCGDATFAHITYRPDSSPLLMRLAQLIFLINGGKSIRDIRDFFPNKKIKGCHA